jgi:tetratricopeptide (TPR) repeat protein
VSQRPDRRRLVLLFFLGVLLWQVVFNTLLLPQHQFRKYPLNTLKFLAHPEPGERWLDFSPLYFLLHLGINATGLPSWTIVPTLQVLLSALALWLFYRTARTFASEGAALAAAALAALYPAYNFYVFCQEPELLLFLLNLTGVFFTVARPLPSAAGCAFGLGVLARPSVLPLALLAGLFQKRRRWVYYLPLAAALGLLLAFARWAVGTPTLAYMSPGTVFYEGNNPEAEGIASMYPTVIKLWEDSFSGREADFAHALYRRASAAEARRPLTLAEHHRLWSRKALAFLAEHPATAARLVLQKVRLAFGNAEVHDIFSLVLVQEKVGPFGLFGFGPFGALALVGLAVGWRRAPPLVLWGAASSLATLCVFYFTSRQRMGFFGFALFLAALGLEAVRRRPWLLAPAGALLALSLVPPPALTAYNGSFQEIRRAGDFRNEATRRMKARDMVGAADALTRCMREAPYLAVLHSSPFLPFPTGDPFTSALRDLPPPPDPYNRGLLRFNALDWAGAREAFEAVRGRPAGKHFYAVEPPLYYIALCEKLLGQDARARDALDEALRRFPGNAAVEGLARAFGAPLPPGRYHDRLTADYFDGRALFLLERYGEALPRFQRAMETAPEMLVLHEHAALCHAYAGNFQAMANELNTIVTQRNEISMLPRWQRMTRELEERFGADPLYEEFLARLRVLFPPPREERKPEAGSP